ncbi:MAG TPA: branched-chain amino acid ABC transporter permease [Kurthia sp.]
MKKSKVFWLYLAIAVATYFVINTLINNETIDMYYSNLLITIMINVILAVSLHLVIGITGQFSIGHAGFLAVGAYVSAICTMNFNMPFIVGLLIGSIAAAIMGLIIGIPTLRLRGDYLAIATLGFAEIIRIVFVNLDYVGGASGMQVMQMTTWTYAFFGAVVTIIVIANFTNSRHGRACIAVREDEIAADSMGINTTYYKVLAFAIGAFFAGLAGGLFSHNFYIIQPQQLGFLKSFDILIYVVLGGLGSMSGAIIAAVLLTVISLYLQDFPETRMIIYSLVLIFVMLYRPSGLMGTKEITDLFKSKRKKGGELK